MSLSAVVTRPLTACKSLAVAKLEVSGISLAVASLLLLEALDGMTASMSSMSLSAVVTRPESVCKSLAVAKLEVSGISLTVASLLLVEALDGMTASMSSISLSAAVMRFLSSVSSYELPPPDSIALAIPSLVTALELPLVGVVSK